MTDLVNQLLQIKTHPKESYHLVLLQIKIQQLYKMFHNRYNFYLYYSCREWLANSRSAERYFKAIDVHNGCKIKFEKPSLLHDNFIKVVLNVNLHNQEHKRAGYCKITRISTNFTRTRTFVYKIDVSVDCYKRGIWPCNFLNHYSYWRGRPFRNLGPREASKDVM